MKFKYSCLAGALLMSVAAQAQNPARPAGQPAEIFRSADGTPELVRFEKSHAPAKAEAAALMRSTLGLGRQTELRVLRSETDGLGFTHERFQQVYQGIPVERATYVAHSRNGTIEWLSGDARTLADGAVDVRPSLTAARALQSALAYVHASKYMWQTPGQERFAQESEGRASFYPTGELVIIDNQLSMDRTRQGKPTLAWKFNVYATQPISRAWIYVDAHTGEVVNQDAIIKHTAATGNFATAYNGTRALATDMVSATSYRLREATRGLGIETYNAKRSNSYTAAVDFTDADNNWTAAEYNNTNKDWVAGDAHFGAQCTYDYWQAVHGRNSYDNAGAKIKSYVHFDDVPGGAGFENAYWNGSVMTYGDGASYFKPLTSMDVCGHEIGHAVCEKTCNLAYQNESGGMNEGFSDIWGACVEARAVGLYGLTGKSTWLIGEEIMQAGGALRSMSNPNAYQQPDTYQGTYWAATTTNPTDANDYGGVHTNSGVLNYWFYLLSQGGSGTNDKGSAFTVTGVTMAKAEKIAFLTETSLSASSNYAAARTAAINAATTLYGAGSAEVIATTNAWYAVGVGAAYGGTTTPAYCASNGTNVSYEYIDKVALGTISRTSGADAGYYNGTALSTSVAQGSSQTITLSAGYVSTAYAEYFNVWVDFNGDKDFADAGEQVVTNKSNAAATGDITATFTVPATATVGAARMRVSMSDASGQTSCSVFTYGEVEDYTLNITSGTGTSCGTPVGLASSAITSSGATVSWTAVSGATSYNVQYKTSAATTWTTTTATTASKVLTGLTASTTYNVQVQAVCTSGSSAYGTAASFTTSAGTTTPTYCASNGTSVAYEYIDKVALGSISRISGADAGYYNGTASSTSVAAGSSQTITVSAGFVGTAYGEYFRIYADWNNDGDFLDAGETLAAPTTSSTLATDRAYAFTVPATALNGGHRLRVVMSDASATASCGTYSYGETEDYTITVTGGTLARTVPAQTVATSAAVYPNPATDVLHVTLPNGGAVQSATVYDLRGARMQNVTFDGQESLQIAGLAKGVYTLTLTDGAQVYHVRFVKE